MSYQDLILNEAVLFGGVYLTTMTNLIFHEASHAFSSLLTGAPIKGIRVGRGISLFRRDIKETQLDIRCFPLDGVVELDDDVYLTKWQNKFLYLSGPISTSLFFTGLSTLIAGSLEFISNNTIIDPTIIQTIGGIAALEAVMHLIPFKDSDMQHFLYDN
jgi:hypothetical protein